MTKVGSAQDLSIEEMQRAWNRLAATRARELLERSRQIQEHLDALHALGWHNPAPGGVREDGCTFHVCPDGHESFLALNEVCDPCQWAPNMPLPSLSEVAKRLVNLLDYDAAVAWSRLLVKTVEGG